MLLSLNIKNYALIENMSLDFNNGLTVITGETGAGKSIIIGALSLALGSRANSEAVRDGCQKASVQALFAFDEIKQSLTELLNEYGISFEDGQILIMREVTASGRSISRINETIVNASALRQISAELIDIHSQHEHQKLFDTRAHMDILDSFGKNEFITLKKKTKQLYHACLQKKHALDQITTNASNEKERLEDYREAYEKISSAKLVVGEEEALEKRLKLLSGAEKLFSLTDEAYSLMYRNDNSVNDVLYTAVAKLDEAAQIDNSLQSLSSNINEAIIAIDDVLLQLRDYKDNIEFDSNEIDRIQNRLEKISALKRRYGASVSDVLHYADDLQVKINNITNYDFEVELLRNDYLDAERNYDEIAYELSCQRDSLAERLGAEINANLKELLMPSSVFIISVDRNESERTENGCDKVTFLFSANSGQTPKELSKVASGGEISRVMLAVKAILADADATETIIFDEIDTGISGRTAQSVAQKMLDLSLTHQVIAITHLPQISSMADNHILVEKAEQNNLTITRFSYLEGEERVGELARMLGGVSVTELTHQNAEEMIKQANDYRAQLLN